MADLCVTLKRVLFSPDLMSYLIYISQEGKNWFGINIDAYKCRSQRGLRQIIHKLSGKIKMIGGKRQKDCLKQWLARPERNMQTLLMMKSKVIATRSWATVVMMSCVPLYRTEEESRKNS